VLVPPLLQHQPPRRHLPLQLQRLLPPVAPLPPAFPFLRRAVHVVASAYRIWAIRVFSVLLFNLFPIRLLSVPISFHNTPIFLTLSNPLYNVVRLSKPLRLRHPLLLRHLVRVLVVDPLPPPSARAAHPLCNLTISPPITHRKSISKPENCDPLGRHRVRV